MDILSYLSELVQTRKLIGISGLGTICKKKLPGRYDVDTHSFIPPSYILEFTEEMKEDILLPEFISKKRNVSAETAAYFINEFSTGVQQQLNDHQEADLGVLGKLKRINDALVFVPAAGLEYGFDFYGLPTVKAESGYIAPAAETTAEKTTAVETIGDPAETTPEDNASVIPAITPETAPQQIQESEEMLTQEENTQEEEQEKPVSFSTSSGIPAEEITIESVTEENQISEENPGTDSTEYVAEENSADTTHTTADHTNTTAETTETEGQPVTAIGSNKEANQLYAEIEALNTYRAKSTDSKISVTEQEEIIWNLKEPVSPVEASVNQYHTLPDVPPDPEVEKSSSATIKVLIGIAVLLLLCAAVYLLKPDLFKGSSGNASKPAPVTVPDTRTLPVVTDSLAVQDSNSTDSLPKPDVAATRPALPDSTASAMLAETDTTTTFEVIGAAVANQKEADYFIYLMKKSGVTAKIIQPKPGNKKLKMSLGTFKDKAEADKEVARLKNKLKIQGIYTYRNKQ
ncbi:SPOR domain-containing protein [Pedobacter sp. AW31-3R]|uniref:SPOR domain-containing protein n=1 Tax=Pedobacter sp. AW31-3R TaxID=3445781 RepID=UPI003F9F2FD1